MSEWHYGHFDATVHQCSGCGYSSTVKVHVQNHLASKCPSGKMNHRKCTLTMHPLGDVSATRTGGSTSSTTITGNDNVAINGDVTINDNVTINVHVTPPAVTKVYVGSEEERQALEAVMQDPEYVGSLAMQHALVSDVPAILFALLRGYDAPPEHKNIRVVGERVEELRGPGVVTSLPRSKFIKNTVAHMLQAVANVQNPQLDRLKAAIERPEFAMGSKKRKVSRLDAAQLHAMGAREVYALDSDGKRFLAESKERVNEELINYEREHTP